MATITGLTAERMLEIEAASVVDGDVSGNDLILTRQDGTLINAGDVRGPQGPEGPMGSSLEVVSGLAIPDIGVVDQVRAGRQLTPADFTSMGLSAPLGLWNLSNANDSSGNARHLTIKGGVPFGTGINGQSFTAAVFAGSTAQALYIADTGAADPFRIKTGSWGCWFRTAKRGTQQWFFTKLNAAQTDRAFNMNINSAADYVQAGVAVAGAPGSTTYASAMGVDVCDDRWHFAVATFDGVRIRIYVDGVLESWSFITGTIHPSSAPLNIGAHGADASTAAVLPHYGRVDEAFITADVLSDEQVRNLYCASVPHALGVVPKTVSLSVRRKRRGSALASVDFPLQPTRLHNFTNGALTDEGAGNVSLAAVGGGSIVAAEGADGKPLGSLLFTGAHTGVASTDAGLPSGLGSRSFGMWLKLSSGATMSPIGIGNAGNHHRWYHWTGGFVFENGGDAVSAGVIHDGLWHHVVEVDDNSASDGLKRKIYIDGRMAGSSTVLTSLTLGGANKFRLGADHTGALPWSGQIDGAFVYPGVLSSDQVRSLYNKGAQELSPSPKNSADHVEAVELGRLLVAFDTIEYTDSIDLAVMA